MRPERRSQAHRRIAARRERRECRSEANSGGPFEKRRFYDGNGVGGETVVEANWRPIRGLEGGNDEREGMVLTRRGE